MAYSCLFFGEGGRDKKFLIALIELRQFKYHTKKWFISCDCASGSAPDVILGQCRKSIMERGYNLIICFIDLDKLKSDYPKTWEKEQLGLEKKFSEFKIIWNLDNAEDEYKKVIGRRKSKKYKLGELAIKNVRLFINSPYWVKIMSYIKNKEEEIKENNQDGLEL